MYRCIFFTLILSIFLLNSCSLNIPYEKIIEISEQVAPVRKWTFIVYMAADNNLESAAIQDLNELEAAAAIQDEQISILVLIDRSPLYDSTNGNWSDTRLYEVTQDGAGVDTVIRSKRIECAELGISTSGSVELNMADPIILEYLLDFGKKTYPADNYGLIIWGHGTGWRSSEIEGTSAIEPVKAFAIDDTSDAYMSIAAANRAILGKDISILGFDTCFGALIEIAFEFRNSVDYIIGSEGTSPSTGWNYTTLFNYFCDSDFTSTSFGNAAITQFKEQYEFMPGATISLMDLSKIEELKINFELFSKAVANAIITKEAQNHVLKTLLVDSEVYHSSSYPCDAYIDISSMCQKLTTKIPLITENSALRNEVQKTSEQLLFSISEAVTESWSKDSTTNKKIGVHLIPFIASSTPASSHNSGYIKGSGAFEQSEFVRTSTGWVPNFQNQGSLLDIVFYSTLE